MVGRAWRAAVMALIEAFPPPPPLVAHTLTRLRVVRNGDPAALGPLDDLARPWEPATCSPRLREQLWWWCDEVAAWLNNDYAWRPGQLIPACWPAHPHLAHELPVLACLRVDAEAAITPEPLDAWHREALPQFVDRMSARLGESGCRTGSHTDWPAAARHDAYFSEAALAARQRAFHIDTHLDEPPPSPKIDLARPSGDNL